MPPSELPRERTLLDTLKDIDRLYELETDEEVREMLWRLLSDLQDYRRKKDLERKAG
jgi:hypothetical protein